MAKNRSRRLRKKMHIDEFQELGFSVAWRFPEGTSEEQIDKTVDDFINEVIEPNTALILSCSREASLRVRVSQLILSFLPYCSISSLSRSF